MNLRQLRQNDALREKLASEYVLGTLRGGARRRFEGLLEEDAVLRRAVAEWEDRLHPMAEFARPAQPSPQVWLEIEKHLELGTSSQSAGRRSFWHGLREDLAFWRGLGMVSTAAAAVLATVLLTKLPESGTPAATYVATLADDKAQTAMVITGDARRRQLTVRVIGQPAVAADKSLELWAIPKEGTPRSLGLVAAGGTITLPLPENATPDNTPVLAISLEPKGGSPNRNAPTGPVLYKGAWVKI
jgi:anti-sigma-K factor RskA